MRHVDRRPCFHLLDGVRVTVPPVEYFSVDGTWWLPNDPDVRTVGTLSLGAEELSLDLDGSIEPGESKDLFDLPE